MYFKINSGINIFSYIEIHESRFLILSNEDYLLKIKYKFENSRHTFLFVILYTFAGSY